MSVPNVGQGVSSQRTGLPSMKGPQKPMKRGQTGTAKGSMGVPAVTGYGGGGLGSGSPLMGGGGMAVGSLRNNRGQALHPQVARKALIAGMKG